MNIKKYSQAPFLYENKESNTMVIFVHGILEGPKQFRKFTVIELFKLLDIINSNFFIN